MGLLEDIMKTLERIPVWKQLIAMPQKIEKLEARLAALEAKLESATGEICPFCRSPSLKLISSDLDPHLGFAGVGMNHYSCQSCGKTESRLRKP